MNQRQYSLIRGLERAFCVLALLFLMHALEPFIYTWDKTRADVGDSGAGNLKFQVLSLFFYLVAALIALTDYRRLGRLLVGNAPMAALVVVALLSSLWSVYPEASFRRSFALALTTVFALYLVLRFTPRELLELVGWALLVAVAMSFFFSAATSWGVHRVGPHAGTWRGTFGHKNEFGRYMAFGLLTLLLLCRDARGVTRWVWAGGAGGAALLLAMSQSRTAWALAAGLLAAWPLLRGLQAGRFPASVKVPVILVLGFGTLVFLVANFLVEGLEVLGREATLSGRTKIWEAALAAGLEHPWLGAGYRVFWTEFGARNVFAHIGWNMEVGNGHNGYLDVWLELGFVGFALFAATLVQVARRAWRRLTTTHDVAGLWYALIVGFVAIYSLAELVILEQGEMIWTLYMASLFYLTPRRLPQPAARTAPARVRGPVPLRP